MTILYALVARGTVVLAELGAIASGNVSTIARRILDKVPAGGDCSRVSYSQDRHIFHIMKADGLTFLCMASDTFGRRIPFAYLEDIHMRFMENYGKVANTAMNDEFSRVLHQQMDYFSSNPDADAINGVKGETTQVRAVMAENIDKAIFEGGPADAAPPQLDADWEASSLPPKNTNPVELMDILAERDAALMEKNTAYAERDAAYAERDAAYAERDAAYAERDAALMEKNTASAERSAAYAERDAAILQRDIATAERDSVSLNRDAALAALTRLDKKSSGRARRPSLAQATTLDGSKLLQRVDLAEHCTFAAEFHPDATPSTTHAGIMVLGSESGVHRFSRDDKESQLEIFVRTKRKASEFPGRHPKKSRTPQVEVEQAPALEEPGGSQEVLNKRIFRSSSVVQTPIPYCSCTGMNQQCYRWGNGGWQSACCTTLISTFPLPLNPKKRGSRVAGRKMSAGAFDKLLEKLVSEGVNINLPVDLREHWAKHGTNRFCRQSNRIMAGHVMKHVTEYSISHLNSRDPDSLIVLVLLNYHLLRFTPLAALEPSMPAGVC